MNFVQSVIAGYSKYFDFSSRSCRSEYWWFMLFGVFVSFIFNFLKMQSVIPNFVVTKNYNHLILEMIVGWGIIGIPVFSVSVRRLHDIGKSGWFL